MLWRQALEGRSAAWTAKAAVKARQQARGDIMGPATSQVPISPPDVSTIDRRCRLHNFTRRQEMRGDQSDPLCW